MMLVNHVSRYHVAMQAVRGAARWNEKVSVRLMELLGELQHAIAKHGEYILEHKEGGLYLSCQLWIVC